MRDHGMVLFSEELGNLHDGSSSFDGSVEEHCIFDEVFFVNKSTNKEFFVREATSDGDCVMQTDASSGNSSLTSQHENGTGFLTEKPRPECFSGDLVRLSVGDLPCAKADLGNALIMSSPSEGFVLGVPRQDYCSVSYCVTYRVVESSSCCIICSSYQLNQLLELDRECEPSGRDDSKNRSSCLDQSEQKEAVSPISQESYANKVLVIDPTVSVVNVSATNRSKKPRWKDHCFLKLDKEELIMPRNIKNDPRPLLRYHINRLLTAAGWVIGRRKRNSKYNGIGEYVYRSPLGRPFREFRRAWNLCGEILLTEAIDYIPKSESIQWADMSELWTDLSLTVKEIDNKFNILGSTSDMAHLWCLLDPFAKVVFIDKSIRLLKEGTGVKAKRGSVVPPETGSAAKCRKISASETKCLNAGTHQACKYGSTYDEGGVHLFDVPIGSRNGHELLGPESSVKGGEVCTLKSPENSGKISEMRQMESHVRERAHHTTTKKRSPSGSKKITSCCLEDDELLISAIMRTKTGSSTMKWRKSKPLRKSKTPKGSCRLRPRSLMKGAKNIMDGKWSVIASRTVLSWLIHSGVVSLDEVLQYRDIKDGTVIKEGSITRDGVLCRCCGEVLSLPKFSSHCGIKLTRPCANLFMESGKPLTLCMLEAWSAEYKTRRSAPEKNQFDETDQNDDSCGRCGDVGELICCDSCPSAFHQTCLYEQELPEGNWYCPQCRCNVCGIAINDKDISTVQRAWKCSQCERKYHDVCLQGRDTSIDSVKGTWFCGECCLKVYHGLQSRIGLQNLLSDGFSWSLLRCIPGDQKVHLMQRLVALIAECNSKLAVAITILEECFLPMVDIKTGIDMIPQVIYNWGSQFGRLNYNGFYTVILEKDDVIMSVASIRIHGVAVAELPLIATCSKNRRQGMCRRLITCIEEMLKSLKVKMLVVSAIPTLVDTWMVGFGFQPLEEDEKQTLSKINLMVFPGAVWLKKHLYDNCSTETGYEITEYGQLLDDSFKEADCKTGHCIMEPESEQTVVKHNREILHNQLQIITQLQQSI